MTTVIKPREIEPGVFYDMENEAQNVYSEMEPWRNARDTNLGLIPNDPPPPDLNSSMSVDAATTALATYDGTPTLANLKSALIDAGFTAFLNQHEKGTKRRVEFPAADEIKVMYTDDPRPLFHAVSNGLPSTATMIAFLTT